MKYGVPTQKGIFAQGMAGKKSRVPADFDSLKKKARSKMSREAYAYIAGGAGTESTMKANRSAFFDYKLRSRMMQSTFDINMGISLFGHNYDSPLLAAPIGVLELADKGADLAVAKACQTMNIPMVFSNQASFSMEDCAAQMGESPRWFQLYWSKSDLLVESFVHRAEQCGCDAIVVTLDTTALGWRPRDLNLAYLPFLRGMGIAQYSSDPVFGKIVEDNRNDPQNKDVRPPVNLHTIKNIIDLCRRYPGSFLSNLSSGRALTAVKTFINIYMRPELRWEDLDRLRQMTKLPIVVKGIQVVEDAQLAFQYGVDGIIVSNHGGRQIDGGAGALKCLDDITNAMDSDSTVLFDSGIRSGVDVIKALALGAKAVLIGRPYVYGLALDGQAGVETVFRNFLSEIELQSALMGLENMDQIGRDLLV